MKGVSYITAVLLPLMLAVACSDKNGGGGKEFFSGKFTLDENGQARFTDCATFMTMDVRIADRYREAVKRYSDMMPALRGEVFLRFTGEVIRKENEDVPGLEPFEVEIDSIISMERGGGCISGFTIPGIYESYDTGNSRKLLLRIKPNYTYTCSTYNADGTEEIASGIWYRTAMLTLSFRQPDNERDTESFQIIPASESLSGNSGGQALVFKKVYM